MPTGVTYNSYLVKEVETPSGWPAAECEKLRENIASELVPRLRTILSPNHMGQTIRAGLAVVLLSGYCYCRQCRDPGNGQRGFVSITENVMKGC